MRTKDERWTGQSPNRIQAARRAGDEAADCLRTAAQATKDWPAEHYTDIGPYLSTNRHDAIVLGLRATKREDGWSDVGHVADWFQAQRGGGRSPVVRWSVMGGLRASRRCGYCEMHPMGRLWRPTPFGLALLACCEALVRGDEPSEEVQHALVEQAEVIYMAGFPAVNPLAMVG